MTALELAGIAGAFALLALVQPEVKSVTRRGFARLVIWAGAGLSLLPGCGSHGPTTPSPSATPQWLIARWLRLGRLWRKMSSYRSQPPTFDWRILDAFRQIWTDMDAALDELPAWPELRVVCEERWVLIHSWIQVPIPCYPPTFLGECVSVAPQEMVEEQVRELEELLARGTLTRRAALKAARTIAMQAERMLGRRKAGDDSDPVLAADLAGKRLVELTIKDLGGLAGPPQENEGLRSDQDTCGADL